MNKRLKKALKASFEAPPPMGKEQFIKALRFPKTTYRDFFASQFFFIRKRVWLVSFFIVAISWIIIFRAQAAIHWEVEGWKIWSISAAVPFMAMMSVTEIYRSAACHLAELEISCRFNLPQIIVARLIILGGGNFAVLILLLSFLNGTSTYNILQMVVYLMVPYLTVCGICLWILNHAHSQEGVYGCAAATCLVCVISMLFRNTAPALYTNACLKGWLALFTCCCVVIGVQIRKLLKQTEEQTWNLFLTE